MPKSFILGCLLVVFFTTANGQDTIKVDLAGFPVTAVVQNGDTVFMTNLDPVNIVPRKTITSTRDMRQYRKLIYNVKKVYPYAKLAGEKYGEVMMHLESLKTAKEQREYIKQIEADILKQYEAELKELTITQGRILIKLIDRETSQTSYDVVKDLRGSFQAAFWQTIARLFGSSLKTEFDPEGEDKMLNEVMIMIEMGLL